MTNLHHLSAEAVRKALDAGRTVATAESLTAILQGGVVAYQNSVKDKVLDVPSVLLARVGSVDPDVAAAMAAGARTVLSADIGISTTGVAGPEAHDGKPVGTVYVGVATADGTAAFEYAFSGSRAEIRGQACGAALERLLEALSG